MWLFRIEVKFPHRLRPFDFLYLDQLFLKPEWMQQNLSYTWTIRFTLFWTEKFSNYPNEILTTWIQKRRQRSTCEGISEWEVLYVHKVKRKTKKKNSFKKTQIRLEQTQGIIKTHDDVYMHLIQTKKKNK